MSVEYKIKKLEELAALRTNTVVQEQLIYEDYLEMSGKSNLLFESFKKELAEVYTSILMNSSFTIDNCIIVFDETPELIRLQKLFTENFLVNGWWFYVKSLSIGTNDKKDLAKCLKDFGLHFVESKPVLENKIQSLKKELDMLEESLAKLE